MIVGGYAPLEGDRDTKQESEKAKKNEEEKASSLKLIMPSQ